MDARVTVFHVSCLKPSRIKCLRTCGLQDSTVIDSLPRDITPKVSEQLNITLFYLYATLVDLGLAQAHVGEQVDHTVRQQRPWVGGVCF